MERELDMDEIALLFLECIRKEIYPAVSPTAVESYWATEMGQRGLDCGGGDPRRPSWFG